MTLNGDSVLFEKMISDFSDCITKYNQLIDDFFSNMLRVPEGWESDESKTYCELVAANKTAYTNFGEALQKFSSTLSNVNTGFDSAIKSSSK